jgi:pyruvate ferredoxin oxidoreductase alpha subunit
LRRDGKRVGVLRLRLIRPFPAEAIASALAGRRGVAVIDQNLAPGSGGILFHEVTAAVAGRTDRPAVLRGFVGGLGGKDISLGEFRHVLDVVEAGRSAALGRTELLFTETDWQQVEALVQAAQSRTLVEETP